MDTIGLDDKTLPSLDFDLDAILKDSTSGNNDKQSWPSRTTASRPLPDFITSGGADPLDLNLLIASTKKRKISYRQPLPAMTQNLHRNPHIHNIGNNRKFPNEDDEMPLSLTKRMNNDSRISSSSKQGQDSDGEEPKRFALKEIFLAAVIVGPLLLTLIIWLSIWLRSLTDQDQSTSSITVPDAPTLTPLRPNIFDSDPSRPSQLSTPNLKPNTSTLPPVTSPPNSSPTEVSVTPTTPPSKEAWDGLEAARNRFLELATEASFSSLQQLQQEKDSPQFRAYEWIVHDRNFFSYESYRIIQRWALTVFAFGFSSGMLGDDQASTATARQQQLTQPLKSWAQYETHECTWFSTNESSEETCNADGSYIQLNLRYTLLDGTLPSEVSLLSNLAFIFLNNNRIHGTLPSELGKLTNLERFQITKNSLKGSFPTEFGNLGRLVLLGIGRNDFSGALPSEIGQLSRLRTAGLERNRFSSTIPTDLGGLRDIEILNLDHNELFGTIPVQISSLSRLEEMNLGFNDFIGVVPLDVCRLESLVELYADCETLTCPCCTRCY